MEWVETTGRTLEEAKEAALDQLGVAEDDAEFEVLDEPKSGLFGRLRAEARVRARVRPATPRPKVERPRRKGRERSPRSTSETTATSTATGGGRRRPAGDARQDDGGDRQRRRGRSGGRASSERGADERGEENEMIDAAALEEQGGIVRTFVDGLVEAFGASGTSEVVTVDEETVEVRTTGGDLGLLIGPRGATLDAVQELARTVVQRHTVGARAGRIRVDIGGYREQRREALGRFALDLASKVLAQGTAHALEPMNAADRKVVHDAVNTVEGVATTSEGEEPRRRVVIRPDESTED